MRLTIHAIKEEAADVKTFVLLPEEGKPFIYKAGQFLTFLNRHHGREERRSYSMSSAPHIDLLPAITVKRIANGRMSRALIDAARPGDLLETTGPASGIFTLPADVSGIQAIWLFAAGIGITPIFPIIKQALHHTALNIVLVYSSRSRGETVFYKELQRLQEVWGARLSIRFFWSNTRNLVQARFSRASFSQLLAEYLRSPVTDVLCYTCGPARYMWLVQLLLEEAGVPSSAIRREVFVVDKMVPRSMPPDTSPHLVHAGGQTFSVQYPETILTAARRQGIVLPYSCEAGQCGSCTAICTAGEVWMSYNEVLTDADMAAGRVLTCTGYPVFGDITLRY